MIHAPRFSNEAYREVVVDAGRPAISRQDVPLEGAGWKEPLVQLFAAAAERLVTALAGAGAEAVGRHAKAFTRSSDTASPRLSLHGTLES